MTEDQHREWDIIFKFLAGIGAVVSFYFGMKQFEISSRREFSKEFYQEQIIFYKDLVLTSSRLANITIPDSTRTDLYLKFDDIYIGKKDYYVNDTVLHDYIRKFNDALTFMKDGEALFSENQTTFERAEEFAEMISKRSRENIYMIINELEIHE